MQTERQREDAWWAGVVVIGGVFGVLSSCCLSPLPSIWLSCEGKKHPVGMSTSPGATDGSQRNSCKCLNSYFLIEKDDVLFFFSM